MLVVSIGRRIPTNPVRLLWIAFGLLIVGVALPILMVMGFLPTTLPLNFVSYGASVGGLFTGILGASLYVGERRKDRE